VEKRIPVLVVSGFLGAGKTTLVRHLLHDAQRTGVRVAVVSNEFGALGIDKALLGEGEAAYVEIEGGCVCCQLSDTLLMEGRDLEGTFEDQVSSADLLLLNKVDLIPPEGLGQVEAMLYALAPETPMVRSIQGSIDPAVLFPPDLAGIRSQRRTARPAPPPHQHDMFHAQEISVEEGIEPDVLSERLRHLGTLRAKGFVRTSQGLRLVQGVGRRIELTEVTLLPPPALLGRVVVITRSASPVCHEAQPAP
jgi:G3E family GTPase